MEESDNPRYSIRGDALFLSGVSVDEILHFVKTFGLMVPKGGLRQVSSTGMRRTV